MSASCVLLMQHHACLPAHASCMAPVIAHRLSGARCTLLVLALHLAGASIVNGYQGSVHSTGASCLCPTPPSRSNSPPLCRQVRDPTKYGNAFPSNPRLEVMQGDVTDVAACKRACSGAGGVIYAASGKGYWSPYAVDYEGVKVGCGRAVLWRDRAGGRTVKAAGFWLWRGLLVAAVRGFGGCQGRLSMKRGRGKRKAAGLWCWGGKGSACRRRPWITRARR